MFLNIPNIIVIHNSVYAIIFFCLFDNFNLNINLKIKNKIYKNNKIKTSGLYLNACTKSNLKSENIILVIPQPGQYKFVSLWNKHGIEKL